MISFRFHIVSITAVFLAIAIGVVVGSTFVDRAIVDGLEQRIDNVSQNLDERRAEIADLEGDIGRLDDYTNGSASFAVSGRLTDQAVLVLAARGVDHDAVEATVRLATDAGAVAPGILWVEPRWSLADDGAADELADIAGTSSTADADDIRAEAWDEAIAELVAPPETDEEAGPDAGTSPDGEPVLPVDPSLDPTATSEPPLDPTSTSTTESVTEEPPDVEVLTQLLEGGFLTFEPVTDGGTLESLAARSPAVVVVTGPEADATVVPLIRALVQGLVGQALPTEVAEVYREPAEDDPDPIERGQTAAAAVPDAATTQVSVVDHADLVMGRVAAILAVSDLRRGVVGHYGFGDGASAIVPPFTPL